MITVGTIGYRKIVSASLMTKTESLPKISRKKWTTSASAQHLKQQRSHRKRKPQVLISAPPAAAKSEIRQFPPQDGDRSEGEILRLKRSVISYLLQKRIPYLATDHHRGAHLGRHHQAFQDFQRSLKETTQDLTGRLLSFLGDHLGLRPSVSVRLLRARMARMADLPMSIRLRQREALPFLPSASLHRHQRILSRHLPSRFSFLFLLFVALRFRALLLPLPLSVLVLPLLLPNPLMHLLLPLLSPLFQRTFKTPYQA